MQISWPIALNTKQQTKTLTLGIKNSWQIGLKKPELLESVIRDPVFWQKVHCSLHSLHTD